MNDQRTCQDPLVSVVIPAFNEEARLERCLQSVSDNCEKIVVDGGSTDQTCSIAEARQARVIQAPRGRGRQLNAGAAAAQGDILLFLHADCILPADYRQELCKLLDTPRMTLGAFPVLIRMGGWRYRWVEWGIYCRSRFFHLPYGDQGLFIRKSIFQELGGFPEIPLMEDVALVQKARAHGRIGLMPIPLQISARRWRRDGFLTTTFRNLRALLLYQFGVSPQTIAQKYFPSGIANKP